MPGHDPEHLPPGRGEIERIGCRVGYLRKAGIENLSLQSSGVVGPDLEPRASANPVLVKRVLSELDAK